jgi:hypothetical protein
MNNVRSRANENYRHTKGYIRRGSTRSKNKVVICIVLAITSMVSVVIGVFVLLYGFFKYSFYDAKKCIIGDEACCDDKDAICDITKSKDKCKNMGTKNENGVTIDICKYKKGSIPQPEQIKLDKNNKIAHILLYSGGGLLITTIIIYNVF